MSDNLRLYIKDNSGNPVEINPLTVANAVNISSNINTANVQSFIDNPYQGGENADTYQYVSAEYFVNYTNTFTNEIKDEMDSLNKSNTLSYYEEIDISPKENNPNIPNFGAFVLPVRKGSLFKIKCNPNVEYEGRMYKNDEYILFTKFIEKDQTDWYENDVNSYFDMLIGGNSGLGISRVITDTFDTFQDLNDYYNDESKFNDFKESGKTFYVIIANDEKHDDKISFYKFINDITTIYPNPIEVEDESDLYSLPVFSIIPEFQYTINEEENEIVLVKYIDNAADEITNITLSENAEYKNTVVKVNSTSEYYKWNGSEWVYIGKIGNHWEYLFSHNNSGSKNSSKTLSKINELESNISSLITRVNALENN